MSTANVSSFPRLLPPGVLAGTLLPAFILLSGCAETRVTSSSNPLRVESSEWADYRSLPVELHGVVKGRSKPELASLFPPANELQYASTTAMPVLIQGHHIVLYVNPSHVPPPDVLCSDSGAFRRGPQVGDRAFVVGALCDGDIEVSRASGYVLTNGQDDEGLIRNFNVIRDELYNSLLDIQPEVWTG